MANDQSAIIAQLEATIRDLQAKIDARTPKPKVYAGTKIDDSGVVKPYVFVGLGQTRVFGDDLPKLAERLKAFHTAVLAAIADKTLVNQYVKKADRPGAAPSAQDAKVAQLAAMTADLDAQLAKILP